MSNSRTINSRPSSLVGLSLPSIAFPDTEGRRLLAGPVAVGRGSGKRDLLWVVDGEVEPFRGNSGASAGLGMLYLNHNLRQIIHSHFPPRLRKEHSLPQGDGCDHTQTRTSKPRVAVRHAFPSPVYALRLVFLSLLALSVNIWASKFSSCILVGECRALP